MPDARAPARASASTDLHLGDAYTRPLSTSGSAALLEDTARRLTGLCRAACFGDETQRVVQTYRSLLSDCVSEPSSEAARWCSEISDDHTPIEFSVACVEGRAEVRVLFEPQGHEPTLAAYRHAAIAYNQRLEREFGAELSRFHALEDLFLPPDLCGPFAAWSSVVFSIGQAPVFKTYFNPRARGTAEAAPLVSAALQRLGMAGAWGSLERTLLRRGAGLDELTYFALDLAPGPEARVKVYVRHHECTLADLEAAASAADDYRLGDASDFARAMGGGRERFVARAPVTCASFSTARHQRPVAATTYLPVCAYARDDAEVQTRIRTFLAERGMDHRAYDAALEAFAQRPLAAGTGMQSWVAFRRYRGKPRFTVYLATEARRVFAPGKVPAPTVRPSLEPRHTLLRKEGS